MNYVIRFVLLITISVLIHVSIEAQKPNRPSPRPKSPNYSIRLYNKFNARSQLSSSKDKKAAYDLAKEYIDKYGKSDNQRLRVVKEWVAAYEEMLRARAALYQKFLDNSKGNAEQQKVAFDIGNQYVSTHGQDTDASIVQIVKYIRDWLAAYEKSVHYKKFVDSSKGNSAQRRVAYDTAKSYISKYGTVNNAELQEIKNWVAGYEAAIKARSELYQRFSDNYRGSPEQQRIAYEAGGDYVKKYGDDTTIFFLLLHIKQFLSSYETAQAKSDLYQRFMNNRSGSAGQQKLAYEAGREYLSKHGADTVPADAKKVDFIREWSVKYEKDLQYKTFAEGSRGNDEERKKAYGVGKEYLNKYGKDTEPNDIERVELIQAWLAKYEKSDLYKKFVDKSTGSSDVWKVVYEMGLEYIGRYGTADDAETKAVKAWVNAYVARTILYKKFSDNANGDAERKKIAYETGKEYIGKYRAVDHAELRAVKKWVTEHEEYLAKVALYHRWADNYQVNSAGQQKIAYEAGKEYVSKYTSEKLPENIRIVEKIQKWLLLYEAVKARVELYEKFLNNYKGSAEQQKIAYNSGKEYVRKYEKDPDPAVIKTVRYVQDWLIQYELLRR